MDSSLHHGKAVRQFWANGNFAFMVWILRTFSLRFMVSGCYRLSTACLSLYSSLPRICYVLILISGILWNWDLHHFLKKSHFLWHHPSLLIMVNSVKLYFGQPEVLFLRLLTYSISHPCCTRCALYGYNLWRSMLIHYNLTCSYYNLLGAFNQGSLHYTTLHTIFFHSHFQHVNPSHVSFNTWQHMSAQAMWPHDHEWLM